MSDDFFEQNAIGGDGGGLGDIGTTLQLGNQNFSQLIQAVLSIFPRVGGSFRLSAAATTTVTQASIAANSIVLFVPTNAAAATLQSGASAIYHSNNTAGASFQVTTASGTAAAGTETFNYIVVNLTTAG